MGANPRTLPGSYVTATVLTLALFVQSTQSSFMPNNAEGLIMAFGDFDNNKYVDIVVANNGLKSLSVWYYQGKRSSGASSKLSKGGQTIQVSTDSSVIASVVPGDFDADNDLDIAVFLHDSSLGNKVKLVMFEHKNDSPEEFEKKAIPDITFKGQPLVLDLNGDQIPDFLGNIDDTVMLMLTTSVDDHEAYKPFEFKDSTGKSVDTLHENCGHSFAQLASNAQPDILLCTKNNLQILRADLGKYTLKDSIPFPPSTGFLGTPIVVDIDLDGYSDIVFPTCSDSKCDESSNIYTMPIMEEQDGLTWRLLHSFQASDKASGKSLSRNFETTGQANSGISNNVVLRAGDVNLDGYPDFLAVVSTVGQTNASRELLLLRNDECGKNKNICSGSRGLDPRSLGLTNVEAAAFFDYKEDGGNDLVYTQIRTGNKYVMDNKDISDKGDSTFLKVMVIGGHCGPGGNGPEKCKFGQSLNYGANLPGPTIEYTTLGSNGESQKSIANQLSQSAHQSLQLPYVVFGLGHVPNFVEKLTITLASNKKVGRASMENVIPNSQLILIPYPPDDPSEWRFQLLLTPSDIIWKFAIALAVVVVVLAIIILILQWQEKREDDAEKRQEAHKFHFDAM